MRSKSQPLAGDLGRGTTISDVEAAIASRWWRKDSALEIIGIPKKKVADILSYRIYEVNGEWIRDNLDTTFGTGGHGLVHTFIPLDEVWIDPMKESSASLIFHEIVECQLMLDHSMSYWQAHQKALSLQAGKKLSLYNVSYEIITAVSGEKRKEVISHGW